MDTENQSIEEVDPVDYQYIILLQNIMQTMQFGVDKEAETMLQNRRASTRTTTSQLESQVLDQREKDLDMFLIEHRAFMADHIEESLKESKATIERQ